MNWIFIVGCCAVVAEVGLFLFAIYVIRKQHEILERFHARREIVQQPLRGPVTEPNRDQVHLLLNGVHHSYRAEGHHDVMAIRRGEYPGFSIEGE